MKKVRFFKNGNITRINDYDDDQVFEKLQPAVYTVGQNIFGFYLEFIKNSFEIPQKIYGSTRARAEKVVKTYESRSRSTGVLLTGDKGSGKTMLSSVVANKMLEKGLPVILIEQPYEGSEFITFLSNIGECVLFFDEFAKVFSKKIQDDVDTSSQDSLLSVFDGTHSIKRLILLTENETFGINSYMLNRPGRIFYHFKYKKLEEELVREYCLDHNIPNEIIDAILLRIDSSREFSFDALKAVVEEYLRFHEDIKEIFQCLNIEEPREFSSYMKVVKVFNKETNEEYEPQFSEIEAPDADNRVRLEYWTDKKRKDEDKSLRRVYLDIKDIVERKGSKQIFDIESEKLIVVLDKIKDFHSMSYARFLDY